MGYVLTSFDGLNLPTALGDAGSYDLSSGAARERLVRLPGGRIYDALGTAQGLRPTARLSQRLLVTGATQAAVQTALNALYAKVGVRGSLVRTGADATTHSATAILREVQASRRYRLVVPVTIELDVLTLPWSGTARDVTGTLSASPTGVVFTHAGNATVRNPIITLTAPGGGSMSSISISLLTAGGYQLYTGTIAATKVLSINCGSMTVTNDGVSDYASFALHGTFHVIDEWARIPPGSNTIQVYFSGTTGGVYHVTYNDGWA